MKERCIKSAVQTVTGFNMAFRGTVVNTGAGMSKLNKAPM